MAKKIDSLRHKDKRANIPTEELRDFVAEDEQSPQTMLYPRDPSLDPQLVWKGKDEQDAQDLAVPVVPIYIQEKIHPQALIEDLRKQWEKGGGKGVGEPGGGYQLNLFADFNGIEADFSRKVDFYSHESASQPHWSNRLILGDSLLVMTSLAEKEGLKGQVQMIYIDPPYGIKFNSNWQVSTRKRDIKDGKAEDTTRQPEQIRAFRDTWKLGIHSYLAYLRDRLIAARELLTETGSIFVQIGDENVHLVRSLLDETFGSENFITTIIFQKTSSEDTLALPNTSDYLLWYAKRADLVKVRPLLINKVPGGEGAKQYVHKLDLNGKVERLTKAELANPKLVPKGWRVCRIGFPLTSQHYSKTRTVTFVFNGKEYYPGTDRQWSLDPETELPRLFELGRIYSTGRSLNGIVCLEEMPSTELGNVWTDTGTGSFTDKQIYIVQTSEKVVQRCILLATDPGDLVLDPTCGSGTTAFVAEQWGRRWISIDTSRVALALTRTRLMSSKYPYYLLKDSQEGILKEAELTGKMPPEYMTENDIKKGFVYKRVNHKSLSDIARGNQGEVRILFDQAYEDDNRMRVTGPFTVESLSPHRVLSTADENFDGMVTEQERKRQQDFALMILENLRKSGVQNTRKNERIKFDTLGPHAGTWIQAEGTYSDADGSSKRVAISIGPEHGTVGPQQLKEAAKEAVQGIGFEVLVLCGFAFDPHVSEEAKRYGKLTVLPTRMNPDLAMGDELLKKTGAGNLFMVFGEPDVEIRKKGDKITVELIGVDVYDPTTGAIRSSSTDDIACWFIDSDYNGESFFVRHAYFTGTDAPYDRLKRALRAEIDEEAWESLYSTISRPFDSPESGKIALKVINHYGDEVLKVFEV
jgi:adenine-specific DNA-methyltransferase